MKQKRWGKIKNRAKRRRREAKRTVTLEASLKNACMLLRETFICDHDGWCNITVMEKRTPQQDANFNPYWGHITNPTYSPRSSRVMQPVGRFSTPHPPRVCVWQVTSVRTKEGSVAKCELLSSHFVTLFAAISPHFSRSPTCLHKWVWTHKWYAHKRSDTPKYTQARMREQQMKGQINQIMAETHLNSLFSGLATVLPTACHNKMCMRGRASKERRGTAVAI